MRDLANAEPTREETGVVLDGNSRRGARRSPDWTYPDGCGRIGGS